MVIGIAAAATLAAAAPAAAAPAAVTVPLAMVPVPVRAVRARSRAGRGLTVFDAPLRIEDLRRLARRTPTVGTLALAADAPSYAVDRAPALAQPIRADALLAGDPDRQLTGNRIRRSPMAAGLSLRMTNADGVLASELGVSGVVGRALSRMAAATDF